MAKSDRLLFILTRLGILLITFVVISVMAAEILSIPISEDHCLEYDLRYFRIEGGGGLFGGTRTVQTTERNADYSKEVCVEWTDLLGRVQRR